MKIQIGEIKMDEIKNQNIIIGEDGESERVAPSKTTKYLVPCLKEYGTKFTEMFEKVYKVAAGIGDAILINRDIIHEKHVFLLLNTAKPCHKHFINFLEWVKTQDMYVDDYVYGDIQKSTFHMIIIKFPESYYGSFKTFKLGNYSKMFSQEDIGKFFSKHASTKKVLIKDHNYRIMFTKKLNRMFESSIKPEEFDGELDFKPTDITEIFNHHLKQ